MRKGRTHCRKLLTHGHLNQGIAEWRDSPFLWNHGLIIKGTSLLEITGKWH
ncbi:heat shock protein [Moniliophthora roreri]|nr:heat shock protein [Moniliophthora roreri]